MPQITKGLSRVCLLGKMQPSNQLEIGIRKLPSLRDFLPGSLENALTFLRIGVAAGPS